MGQRGGNHYGKGREVGVKGTESGSIRYRKWEVQNPQSSPLSIQDPGHCKSKYSGSWKFRFAGDFMDLRIF